MWTGNSLGVVCACGGGGRVGEKREWGGRGKWRRRGARRKRERVEACIITVYTSSGYHSWPHFQVLPFCLLPAGRRRGAIGCLRKGARGREERGGERGQREVKWT